jgi:hypothetical protein
MEVTLIFERREIMEDKRNLLEDQIEAHLKKMRTFDPGSEEMGKATRELDTLYKLAQEADADKRKALAEDEEVVRNERRFELEQEKFEYQKKQDRVKSGIEIGGLLLGTGTSIWAFMKGMKFEMDGVFKTTTVKNVFNKILKFK